MIARRRSQGGTVAFLAGTLLAAWATGAQAQAPGVQIGMGPALTGGVAGAAPGAVGRLGVRIRGHDVVVRMGISADLRGFPDSGGGDERTWFSATWSPPDGLGPLPPWLAFGPSVTRFDPCPDDEPGPWSTACHAPGVVAVAERRWGGRGVGFSAEATVDLNTAAPWMGVGVSLLLGWMP